MGELREVYQRALSAVATIGFSDILDILVVAFIIHKLLSMVHTSGAARVAKAIVVILVLTLITSFLKMHMLNFVLTNILSLGFIALVILFQPELRRALERLGARNFLQFSAVNTPKSDMEEAILATVSACTIMSKERIGVLMAFERETSLEEYFKTGTIVDAKVSEQLLRNIFFPKAALHDGAVIIQNGRVAAAGCVMPLTENANLSSDLGTRHRAGVGTSEASDAVVVIVSEETGTISVAIGGMLKRHLAPQTLEKLLTNALIPETEEKKTILSRIKQFVPQKDR